jgi:uncharacterized protein (TIGR03086 family)
VGTDIRELDRRAVLRSVRIVDGLKPDQLDAPTPCGNWTLRELLAHMIAQHNGFAAVAGGEIEDLSVWTNPPIGADPAAEYAAAAERVIAAFAAEGVLDSRFWLPEIRDGGLFPATMGISFHFVDYVVHGWDVAAALGMPSDFDEDLLLGALEVAKVVPTGAARLAPGAAFGPEVSLSDNPSTLDRLLGQLGRAADWQSRSA